MTASRGSGLVALASIAELRLRAQRVLQARIPGALAAVHAHALTVDPGAPTLPGVVQWRRLPDYLRLPERLSPAAYVTSPGTEGEPAWTTYGVWRADYLLRVFLAVAGVDYEQTTDRAAGYAAAALMALRAVPSLALLPDGSDPVAQGCEPVETTLVAGAQSDDESRNTAVASVTVRYLDVEMVDQLPVPDPVTGHLPDTPVATSLQSTVTAVRIS